MIGADPEMGLLVRGVEQGWNWGRMPQTVDRTAAAPIGQDGTMGPGELRPKAASTALELVNNIHALLFQFGCWGTELGAKGGSLVGHAGIGGHIHFDLDEKNKIYVRVMGGDRFNGFTAEVTNKIKLMDLVIALPLSLVENQQDRLRRVAHYGLLSDCREQPWGFEYRTPASWLVSRRWALRVLSLAECLWNSDLLADDNDLRTWETLQNCWTRGNSETVRRDLFEKSTLPIWRQLREDNPKLVKLQPLWTTSIRRGRVWECAEDILPNWGTANVIAPGNTLLVDKNSQPILNRVITSVQQVVRPVHKALFVYQQDSGVPLLLSSMKRKITGVEQGYVGDTPTQKAALQAWPEVKRILGGEEELAFLGVQPGVGVEKAVEKVFKEVN